MFRGARAFSEPESRAIRDFILARRRDIKMYLTLHSYGQMVLYPWGYDRSVTACAPCAPVPRCILCPRCPGAPSY